MKKILIHLLKPLSFLPAILMMYLIYSFSAQTGEVSGALSYEVSYQIVETKNEVLNENKTYDELAYSASSIEFYVRKAAHMTEYCLLAIAISFPLYVYGVRGIWLILLAGAICVGFAGFDEYHQSFVADRGPSVRDVGIDSIGVTAGILLVQAFCWSTLQAGNGGGDGVRACISTKNRLLIDYHSFGSLFIFFIFSIVFVISCCYNHKTQK